MVIKLAVAPLIGGQFTGDAWHYAIHIRSADGGIVIDPCKYCSSTRVAVVLDKRIQASPTPGNKYRKRCLECSRWLPMASAAQFETAKFRHVLPRDADPEGEEPTVPAEEFDGQVRSALTPEQHAERRAEAADEVAEVLADGGTEGVEKPDDGEAEAADDDQDDEDDGDDQDDEEHTFECPRCHARNTGYPEECEGGCGAVYDWTKAETERE